MKHISEEIERSLSGHADNDYCVECFNGIDDVHTQLFETELPLLELDKLKDFGEKIGGSAKDRFHKKTDDDDNNNGDDDKSKKSFNMLPPNEELVQDQYKSYKQYRPSVADFENIGLNKLCARYCYLVYYQAGAYGTKVLEIYKLAGDTAEQQVLSEYLVANLRTLKYANFWTSKILGGSYPALYAQLLALALNIEKTLTDDFDWSVVLKMLKLSGNAQYKIFERPFNSDELPLDGKQKIFNICYESLQKNWPLFQVGKFTNGVVFGSHQRNCSKRHFYSRDFVELDVSSEYSGLNRWEAIWPELYLQAREKWYIAHPEDKPLTDEEKEKKWRFKDKEGMFASMREGKDWRNGRNTEPVDFTKTFGFRAVEFGESMPQKERWGHLNRTYDSFMDLCDILNIKPENISLGGKLAICFGSRGKGGKHAPSAHYEPAKKVINLTRRTGAGCLAHEWFHALDNQLTNTRSYGSEYNYDCVNSLVRDTLMNWRPMTAKFKLAAKRLDGYEGRKKPYWQTGCECFARSFEWYVIKKLADAGCKNEYLAQIPPVDEGHLDMYPYPHESDKAELEESFDKLFKAVEQTETDKGLFTIK